jgi:hypothetical protein
LKWGTNLHGGGTEAHDLVTAQRLEEGLEAAAHEAAHDRTVNFHLADPGCPLDLLSRRCADEADFHSLGRWLPGHARQPRRGMREPASMGFVIG